MASSPHRTMSTTRVCSGITHGREGDTHGPSPWTGLGTQETRAPSSKPARPSSIRTPTPVLGHCADVRVESTASPRHEHATAVRPGGRPERAGIRRARATRLPPLGRLIRRRGRYRVDEESGHVSTIAPRRNRRAGHDPGAVGGVSFGPGPPSIVLSVARSCSRGRSTASRGSASRSSGRWCSRASSIPPPRSCS